MKTPNMQDHYTNLITSLVNTAITHTEGVAATGAILTMPKKRSVSNSNNNVNIYINDNKITLDVYVDVIFGYNVSQVACALQEKIINDITNNIPLTVKNVNIIVNSVIFN